MVFHSMECTPAMDPHRHGTMARLWRTRLLSVTLLTMVFGGCSRPNGQSRVFVVATSTIVGDVVRAVAKDEIAVNVLLPVGVDPHSFEPTPQDVSMLSGARLIFVNGRALESFLYPLLDVTVKRDRVIDLSAGIDAGASRRALHEALPEGDSYHEHDEGYDPHGGVDPHVWFVPAYVALWAQEVAASLSRVDPSHASVYMDRSDSVIAVLDTLDAWIRRQVASIPAERRVLVSDHAAFGHFARAYGFIEIGAILPGFNTLAEPSARDLTKLVERIRLLEAPAVFVGMSATTQLADRIGEDAGIRVARLYTGSLSPPDGPAADYVAFMRYNVSAIVAALKGDE
ncbi:zinc ABC transporter substrate-binding protein [Candidatus Fermentibacteria bacterium]|nr:zinc ABC transporter substrate-binding protein [Candidatus Fermentibacteria bacterium]